ncbi:hypothetical protein LCGC14_2083470, partial [marine sediment metagenome]
MTDLRDDKPMWGVGEVVYLAAPAALGMLNITLTHFVDGIMVARLIGPKALGATFVAGILAFVLISFASGALSVINTFVSQNFGANRRARCGRYTWQGLYLAVAFAAVMIPVALVGRGIFTGLSELIVHFRGEATSPAEMGMQSAYFRILVCGAGFRLASQVLEQYFYGTHRPLIVYAVSLVVLVVNITMNYVLITGWWILPKMGLAGAATGSIIAWGVGLILLMVVFL